MPLASTKVFVRYLQDYRPSKSDSFICFFLSFSNRNIFTLLSTHISYTDEQVLRLERGNVMSTFFGNYDRPTKRPINQRTWGVIVNMLTLTGLDRVPWLWSNWVGEIRNWAKNSYLTLGVFRLFYFLFCLYHSSVASGAKDLKTERPTE